MRRILMSGALVAVLVGVILVAGTTLAQDKPDATLTLSAGHVSAGIGYSWGGGTLTYKGKKYNFSVDGLSVGAVGGASIKATGNVYDLKKLEDFNGNYTGVSAGVTIAGGGGGTALKNQNGVVLKLSGTTQGLKFKLGVDGVKVTLKQ